MPDDGYLRYLVFRDDKNPARISGASGSATPEIGSQRNRRLLEISTHHFRLVAKYLKLI